MKDSNEKATLTTVAKINNVQIVVVKNENKDVPIKPICEAIGIASNGQIEKIKSDPILSSVGKTVLSTGADGKQYEMFSIPFKYTFGWLFTIDSRLVKEEARQTVLKYQMECYDALYNHFTAYADFVEQKQIAIEQQLVIFENAKANFQSASKVMKDAEQELKKYRQLIFEEWEAEQSQLSLFSTEEQEG